MELILTLKDELRHVSDPRVLGRTHHPLIDILVLTVLAFICGAQTWYEVEDFAERF